MSSKTKRIILVLVLSIYVLTACSLFKSNQPVKPTTESGSVLFADDFSVSPNGWGTMGRSDGEIGFEAQGLVISVNLPNFLFWTVNGDRYTDTTIDVDAVLLDGPVNDNFGVICRFQDNENFYGFLVSHDGYYGIFQMANGVMTLATPDGNLQYSEAIRQGGVVNHIQAICQHDLLSLTVNGTLLSMVQDSSFSEGRIGLIAGAYATPGVKVLFDNLVVTQP